MPLASTGSAGSTHDSDARQFVVTIDHEEGGLKEEPIGPLSIVKEDGETDEDIGVVGSLAFDGDDGTLFALAFGSPLARPPGPGPRGSVLFKVNPETAEVDDVRKVEIDLAPDGSGFGMGLGFGFACRPVRPVWRRDSP